MPTVLLRVLGREQLELSVDVDSVGTIINARLTGVGDRGFLIYLDSYRKKLRGKLAELPLPEGTSPAELLVTEAVQKARGEWHPTFTDEEVCHCRGVSLKIVDAAVVCGAHSPEKVSAWTSASTACGTCRPDVETHLAFRLRSGK
jgi:bacterioferritin-associated ferredoxin